MRKFIDLCALCTVLSVSVCLGASHPDGFVLIEGGTFNRGTGANQRGTLLRVEDFEILDHPVTNAEYGAFVKETGHSPPLHWVGGKIPKGKGQHPVIFVNRIDVNAYLHWLSRKSQRLCRLPTRVEFEYAARGGLRNQPYPWGSDHPGEKANYEKSMGALWNGGQCVANDRGRP
jgi:formylglycine-generating enzyme required for sulfatase activity